VAALLVILRAGTVMHPALPVTAATPVLNAPSAGPEVVLRLPVFLAQIAIILCVARLLGAALRRLGQPQVVGEMLAGIVLGPSLLGWVSPTAYALLFPIGSVRFVGAVSQLGLMLFMFLVGLELRLEDLRGNGHAAVLTSHASIIAPMVLGSALALVAYPLAAPPGVSFVPFALFLGAAMSVTAFPVLARLLAERGLRQTRLGALTLAAAAIDDVSAWCILAAVVGLARANTTGTSSLLVLGGAALFVLLMLTVVRPFLAWVAARRRDDGKLSHDTLAAIAIVMLASAWLTQRIGVHALFGAFVAGVVMPKDAKLTAEVTSRFEDLLFVVLLPLFFAATGIRTSIAQLGDAALWGLFGLVMLVAIVGKIGGSALAARVAGLSWSDAAMLGALMNTRGLMGLVILNVGMEIGVMTPALYAMMVLMAIGTTCMTAPLLRAIDLARTRRWRRVTLPSPT
jgi:Kef-type K+ transport system membrane component KefB